MRFSRTRTALLAALPAVLSAAVLATTPSVAAAAGAAFPAHYAAPYLQISDADAGQMAADQSATGTKFYTLAFLTPQSGCTPVWEANGTGVGSFKSQISALQAAGGNVIPSFGGAARRRAGPDLHEHVEPDRRVRQRRQHLRHATAWTSTSKAASSATRRRTSVATPALAALQQQNPAVQVDYTLAVDPTGIPSNEQDLLRDAKNKGVKVSVVNLMVMDFYDGQPVLSDALSAARASASQLASLYGISTSAAYAMMGLTPIAGRNDDGAQFSQSDAQQLETFAAQNGVAELSFWELQDYDRATGYAYSRIFNAITGGTTTPPPPPGRRHDHRLRRQVRRRGGRELRERHDGRPVHVQRHERPAVDVDVGHPPGAGQVPGRQRGGHGERHEGPAVRLQRNGRPAVDGLGQPAGEPGLGQVPGRDRPQLGGRNPAADLDVHRRGEPVVDPALSPQ